MWWAGRSIRFRLLAWYALVLAMVVSTFGVLLYYEVRQSRLKDLDAELEGAAIAIEAALRLFPRHELTDDRPPPRASKGAWEKKGGEPPFPRERLLATLEPPGEPGSHPDLVFAVWRGDGRLLKTQGIPDGITKPLIGFGASKRFLGEQRQVILPGPELTVILVARSATVILIELRQFALQLLGTGLAVWMIGMAGGWLLSQSIVRPVAAISAAASRISATNLSERIDVAHIDAELAGLARVLNETFDRLEAAFARQARFTADASHELRTPLAVLKAQAELALSRPRTPPEYQEALRACVRSTERMTELIQRMLDMARADEGIADLKRDRVDFAQIVREIATSARALADHQQVSIHVDLVRGHVHGDATALGQVVANLITNAIKYNRPGGRVRIVLRVDLDAATLSVEDSGCGIAPHDHGKVFERFFRADKARSRSTGGAGLGLAICKVIVEAHGGTIDFQSVPEVGSIFRVRLPRVP